MKRPMCQSIFSLSHIIRLLPLLLFPYKVSGAASFDPTCPCINSEAKLAKYEEDVLFDSRNPLPLSYGSSQCDTHDYNVFTGCIVSENEYIESFCNDEWCYVDKASCRQSTHEIYWTDLAVFNPELELYYSYSTCNSTDNWSEYQTNVVMNQTFFEVVIPDVWEHVHEKDLTGLSEEDAANAYYNDSIPWSGIGIDFFNALIERSPASGCNFTFRSKSTSVYSDSTYTQAVYDVGNGVADMAFTAFWLTSERLEIAPFALPIAQDPIHLWIKRPEDDDNSFKANITHMFGPLDRAVWLGFFFSLLIVSILNVWFSTTKGSKTEGFEKMRSDTWKYSSNVVRAQILARTFLDSIFMSFNSFLARSTDFNPAGTMAQKILIVGFSLVVFIIGVSYTASLTAFLTEQSTVDYIGSMTEAVEGNAKVCVSSVLEADVRKSYSTANLVTIDPGMTAMIDAIKEGMCDCAALSWFEVRLSETDMNELCDIDYVSTESLIVEISMAFPVRTEYLHATSYWISQELTASAELFADENLPDEACTLTLEVDSDTGLESITLSNLALPFLFFTLSTLVAIVIHIRRDNGVIQERKKKSMRMIMEKKKSASGMHVTFDGEENGDTSSMQLSYDVAFNEEILTLRKRTISRECLDSATLETIKLLITEIQDQKMAGYAIEL